MIIDGKQIASEILKETMNRVTHCSCAPHAVIVTCAPTPETGRYLKMKLDKATACGIGLSVVEFPTEATTDEMVESMARLCMQTDAVVVQLPLPHSIDTDAVIEAIPESYDADGLHFVKNQGGVLPPVVGAIEVIAERFDVSFANKEVVLLGHGRLVGQPAAVYAKQHGANVTVLTEESTNQAEVLKTADILILGAGVPHYVLPEMVKPGSVIFDAGTSEDNGQLLGDAHPDCANVASLMTPVPGGIGPLTIALLLRNIVSLAEAK